MERPELRELVHDALAELKPGYQPSRKPFNLQKRGCHKLSEGHRRRGAAQAQRGSERL
jgi:hypothetical protein